jgi:hypothetical protein
MQRKLSRPICSADERAGKPVQITGAWRFGRGPGYIAYVFVFLGSIIICRRYRLTLSDQAQVTLKLGVSLSDLVQRILAGPPLLGGGASFLRRASNPLSAALPTFMSREQNAR